MHFATEFTVPAERHRVWQLFREPERIAGCIPGCRAVRRLEESRCEADVEVRLPFLSVGFRVVADVREEDPGRALVVDVVGDALAIAGSVRSVIRVELDGGDLEETRLRLQVDAQLGGRLAGLGEVMLREALAGQVQRFVDNLRAALRGA